jgi:DNA-directed RNA polymerase specialized sigma24 family protein
MLQHDSVALTPEQDHLRIAERQREVARLYLQGCTQVEIGRRVGISQATVSHDVAAVREQWRRESVRDMAELLTVELAKLDLLEKEYWAGWRRSQGRAHRVAVADDPAEPGDAVSAADGPPEVREFPGNPAFLAGVERVIERRCKLLGLDAPQRVAVEPPVKLVSGVDLDAV